MNVIGKNLSYLLMALDEGFLQQNYLRLSDPDGFKPLSEEEVFKLHEAALSIGMDYESRTLFVKNNPQVALIPIIGPTDKYGGWSTVGTMHMGEMLRRVKGSGKYKAVVFYIDSPGGSVDGMQDWSEEMMNVGLPTLAYIDGMGASGGIWQAVSTDRIIANAKNDNIIGSVGVQTIHVDRSEVLKKTVGDVKIIRAKQSTLKNAVNSFEPLSKEGEQWIVERLSESAEIFINHVKARRPNIKADSDVFKGQVFSTDQALAEGLIDGTASFDDAVSELLASTGVSKSKQSNPNSNHNSQSMKFKSVFTAILAAIGFASVKSEDEAPLVTEERLEALNAVLQSSNETIAGHEQRIVEHEATIAQLKTDLQAKTNALATAEADRDKFAKQAGAAHVPPHKDKAEGGNAEPTEEEAIAAEIAALPHNRALDGNPLFN